MKIGYCHQKEGQCHSDLTCDISASFQANTFGQADYTASLARATEEPGLSAARRPALRGAGSHVWQEAKAQHLWCLLYDAISVGDHYRMCIDYQLCAYCLPVVVPVYSSD